MNGIGSTIFFGDIFDSSTSVYVTRSEVNFQSIVNKRRRPRWLYIHSEDSSITFGNITTTECLYNLYNSNVTGNDSSNVTSFADGVTNSMLTFGDYGNSILSYAFLIKSSVATGSHTNVSISGYYIIDTGISFGFSVTNTSASYTYLTRSSISVHAFSFSSFSVYHLYNSKITIIDHSRSKSSYRNVKQSVIFTQRVREQLHNIHGRFRQLYIVR